MDLFMGLTQGFRGFGAPIPPQQRKGGRGGQHKKQCNCKNSRCLKLYCECFASGRYCDGCNCSNCFNNHENEATRQSAVEAILERNPNAFRPKIQEDGMVVPATVGRHPLQPLDVGAKHSKGCNCKKSACLKKYCECFQANVFCTDQCKCIDCKNFEGSEQRSQVMACINYPGMGIGEPSSPMGLQSPSKRLRTMSGGLPGMPGIPGPSMSQFGGPQVQPKPLMPGAPAAAPRPVLHQVVGDIVKGSVIEELCRLLFLVADEEADRQAQNAEAAGADPGAAAARQKALKDAQERVVLEEFLSMFRKMTDTANKKAQQQAQTQQAAAAAAAAAAAVAAATQGQQAGGLNFGGGGLNQNMLAAAVTAAVMGQRQQQQAQFTAAGMTTNSAGTIGLQLGGGPAPPMQQQAQPQQMQAGLNLAQQQQQQQTAALNLLQGLDASGLAAVANGGGGGVGVPGGGSFTSMLQDPSGNQLIRELIAAQQAFAGGGVGGGSSGMQLEDGSSQIHNSRQQEQQDDDDDDGMEEHEGQDDDGRSAQEGYQHQQLQQRVDTIGAGSTAWHQPSSWSPVPPALRQEQTVSAPSQAPAAQDHQRHIQGPGSSVVLNQGQYSNRSGDGVPGLPGMFMSFTSGHDGQQVVNPFTKHHGQA